MLCCGKLCSETLKDISRGKKKSQTLIWKDRLILHNMETTTLGTDWTSEKCLSNTDSSDIIYSTFGPSYTSKLQSLIGQLFLSSCQRMFLSMSMSMSMFVLLPMNVCIFLRPRITQVVLMFVSLFRLRTPRSPLNLLEYPLSKNSPSCCFQ